MTEIINDIKVFKPIYRDAEKAHIPNMNTYQEKNISIFRIANGVKPWTLVPTELANSTTPGLSIIMQLPSATNDHAAMELFITHAEGIAIDLGAQLKNAKQKNFAAVDKEELLASVS